VPVKSEDRAKRRGPFPYYGASGVIDTIDDYLFDGDFLLIAEDGANLLSRSTPIAFKASGKFWVNNHAHIVQTFCGVPLRYLETVLNGMDLQEFVTGSAQPKLTQQALNGISIPLPALAEQNEIVRRVEALLTLIDNIGKRVEATTGKADKLTQSILAKAFRGELVPTEAELARREGREYEPASVLLERIKSEKASLNSGDVQREKQTTHGRRKRRAISV
jgi:type I restriction enzyme S subunit